MTPATQQQLFPLALDESKLGPNQQDVLAWIDRWGSISVREAGRIVYRNRRQNPDRIDKAWLEAAGFRVLISLRERDLLTSEWGRAGLWRRRGARQELAA
jgi:hypothetical protein